MTVLYKKIDEDFMSQPKYIYILKRFFNYIDSKNLKQEDLQKIDVVHSLLKHAFSSEKTPDSEYVESVQELFKNTSVTDFKHRMYRYSAYIAMYLWIAKVQKVSESSSRKLKKLIPNCSLTEANKMYCSLREIQYVQRSTSDLRNDQDILIFKNTLRCTDEILLCMRNFINKHLPKDLDQEQKDDVTRHARRFL